MNVVKLSTAEYHGLQFKRSQLPDLAAAGPVSASILKELANPIRFFNFPKRDTSSLRWGSMVDCMWLTPENWLKEYAELPKGSPRDLRFHRNAKSPSVDTLRAIKWWDDWDRINTGKNTVAIEEVVEVRRAVDMLNRHPIARELHEVSSKQICLLGAHPDFPHIETKAMLDLLPMEGRFEDCIVDLKTTNETDNYGYAKAITNFQYGLQLGYYGYLAEKAGLGPRPRGILIFQNNKRPFDVHIREIDQADLRIGRAVAEHRLRMLETLDPQHVDHLFDTEIVTVSRFESARTKDAIEINPDYTNHKFSPSAAEDQGELEHEGAEAEVEVQQG